MKPHHTNLPARKPRTVKAMREFLNGHFRYSTMNSWNGCTSYAVNIKLPYLRMTKQQLDKCYELLSAEDCLEESGFSERLERFARENDWRYQIGINGRSGGYAVLYQGGRKPTGYKSFCTKCYQQNCTEATETNKRCGKCGCDSRVNYTYTHTTSYTVGKGIDEDGVDEMDSHDIRCRFREIWAFDVAVEEAVAEFVAFAMRSEVEEVEILVPHRVTRVKRDEEEG